MSAPQSLRQAADDFRIEHQLPNQGEVHAAIFARSLVDDNGVPIPLGETVGNLATIPEGQTVIIDANSQQIIYGDFVVYGTYEVLGEVRYYAWPDA